MTEKRMICLRIIQRRTQEVPLEVPQEEDDEQGEPPLEDMDYPDNAVEGFGSEQPHYEWDELNDEETLSFRANALWTLDRWSGSTVADNQTQPI